MRKTTTAAAAATLLAASMFGATAASAATIVGSFSLLSFGGSYLNNGAPATALTATGLDFGSAGGSTGNGYGTNGTALVGNATGAFVGFGGTFASIADLALSGATANPYTANPFLTLGNYTVSFSNAAVTRSPLGTSVTVTGSALFADTGSADVGTGDFSLSVSSQQGSASNASFTFTSNVGTAPVVPEPATWAMMVGGFGLVGAAMRRRKTALRFA